MILVKRRSLTVDIKYIFVRNIDASAGDSSSSE